jgi:hypothetical protein
MASYWLRYWWIEPIATESSPTAPATRLTEPCRIEHNCLAVREAGPFPIDLDQAVHYLDAAPAQPRELERLAGKGVAGHRVKSVASTPAIMPAEVMIFPSST